jgi:hypothetical protein
VVAEDGSDDSVSKCFEYDDSGSSIVWTEESSEEDLDYFAVLDVAVDETGKRELLSSPAGASVGEGELRSLFAGEELRIMLFNYREMGIIPKVEPM